MATLIETIYRFSVISIKNTNEILFVETVEKILKFIRTQGIQIIKKTNLKILHFLFFKTSYKAIVIKTV